MWEWRIIILDKRVKENHIEKVKFEQRLEKGHKSEKNTKKVTFVEIFERNEKSRLEDNWNKNIHVRFLLFCLHCYSSSL